MHRNPPMGKIMRALGTMSGTSMDGIDVALIDTDGEDVVERGPSRTFPYEAAFKSALAGAIEAARGLTDRSARPGCLTAVERELTERHTAAVGDFLKQAGVDLGQVEVLGFHGQTVLHKPEQRLTVQLGDGPALACGTGLRVVYDL